jgi:hypothetical protein
MTEPVLTSAQLNTIIDELRLMGFNIGTEQYLAAQNLLLALAAQGSLSAEPRKLKTWLAPVLCASPKEQETFYYYFEKWLDRRVQALSQESNIGGIAEADNSSPIRPNLKVWLRRRLRQRSFIATSLAVLLAAIAAIVFFAWKVASTPRTLSGSVVNDENEPVEGARISFKGQTVVTNAEGHFSLLYTSRDLPVNLLVSHPDYEALNYEITESKSRTPLELNLHRREAESTATPTPADTGTGIQVTATPPEESASVETGLIPARYFDLILACALLLPVAIFLAWWLRRFHKRRRMQLNKRDVRSEQQLDELLVRSAVEKFFHGSVFRRIAQELRRHRRYGSNDIDVQPTVNATIRQGGWFTPVYGSRLEQPEYLALIDRASFSDQQAHLEDELIKRLIKDNVLVERFYFHEDPLVCRRENPNEPYLDLQDLSARYPNHNLLIFSDGATFVNPFTGQPQSWLDLLTAWQVRALLTPETPANWGYREWALSNQEFIVVPANKAGMITLVEIIGTGKAPNMKIRTGAQPFPEMLQERPLRWVEKHEPERDTVNRLCFQLRRYLGDEGYYLFGACAVYPQLHWDLTLYLACQLCEKDALEENLRTLVRLPWFRHGSMPNWLRLRLISTLPRKREESVRQALTDLLLSSALKAPERRVFSLPFVKRKSVFWELIKSESHESPLREHVFLNFMSGYKPSKLALTVPEAVRRIIYPQGQKPLGVRPSIALLLALFFSSAGLISIAYTQPETPSMEAVKNPIDDITPPPITADLTYTYNPTGGAPGNQYQILVASSDCARASLKGSTLISPATGGIRVDSVVSDDCQLSATLSVAANASPGKILLTVAKENTEVTVISFTIAPTACPRVIINCPQALDSGGTSFTARIIGGQPRQKAVYNWTVSAGTITGGQGTPSIVVSTQGSAEVQAVTASVLVTGYDAVCPTSAVCSAKLIDCPAGSVSGARIFDFYGNIGLGDEKARLDNFTIELQSNPQTRGYIVYYNENQARAVRAMNYLANERAIDRSRLKIIYGGACSNMSMGLEIGPFNRTPAELEVKRTDVKAKWASVENQLQRRADLMPNLIESMKLLGVQEQDLFGAAAEARSKLLNALSSPPHGEKGDKTPGQKQAVIDMDAEFSPSIEALISLEESYPQLKKSAAYQKYIDELAGIENRIAVARSDYNEAAQDYNAMRGDNPEEPYFRARNRRGRLR